MMMMMIKWAVLLTCLCMGMALGQEFPVKGRVVVREYMTPPTMTIRLVGGEVGETKSTLTRVSGDFQVMVPPGTYAMYVETNLWTFPHYMVSVSENGKVKTTFTTPNSPQKRDLAHPLILEPYARPVYFEQKKQLNLLSMIIYNPMAIMMIVMAGAVFILPKMMANMDPEELKRMQEEMKKNQKDQPDPEKLLGSFFGGGGGANDSDSD